MHPVYRNFNFAALKIYLKFSALFILLFLGSTQLKAVQYRVLFIGNSYTAVNSLPDIIDSLAVSTGDKIIYGASIAGGTTWQQHTTSATTLALIAQGNWDYVVLQEQSQLPSFPDGQVATDVYPYARKLDSLIKAASPCAKTVFYMTWGRKNGDAANCPNFPAICTYTGMDSLLQARYLIMANANGGLIAPVAKVWRRLRNTQPSIELYDVDESHPSTSGSYAAACSFYSIFFKKSPVLCPYNYGLSAATATNIKNAAKLTAYDSLSSWYQQYPMPMAAFNQNIIGNSVTFANTSRNATTYTWLFGDGTSATTLSATHNYAASGIYTAKLVARKCTYADTVTKSIVISTAGIAANNKELSITLYPNPVQNELTIKALAKIQSISILDLNGKLVLNISPINNKLAVVDVQHLAPGMYEARIVLADGMISRKFIK